MKKKIILHGLGNEGDFNFYIFDKKKELAKILSLMFGKIFNLSWDFYDLDNKKDKFKKNIEKLKDTHESLMSTGSKFRIDIFYGSKKMMVVIHCPPNLRIRFNEELFKFAQMPKPTRIKRIKTKKRK